MLLWQNLAGTPVNGTTTATVFIPVRFLAGAASTGAAAASDLRSFLPGSRHPLAGGQTMDPVWYRFFDQFVNVFAGGVGSLKLADLLAAVQATQAQATQATATTQAIATQSQANAEALAAAVQVVQAASLPGSEQIPQVLNSYTDIPP